jgi:hypothetical protein
VENEEVDPGVDSEIDDEEIWYTDDPVADLKIDWFYKLRSFAPIAIVLLVTTIYLPSTVGGKITLNSNSAKIEFGQGVVQTQYCGLSASISVNLYSTFKNGSPGDHYLDKIKVSGIPAACANKEFKIQLFDDSSPIPLALYGSTTNLTFSNTTAYKPCGDPDLSFDTKTVSSATEFNFNIASPTLLSGTIAKFVVMSGGLGASYTQFPAVATVTPPFNTVGTTETFTSGAASGKSGPSLTQLKTAYSAATWELDSAYLNVSTNGFQQFTICHAGTYEITAYGANGGSGSTAGGGGKGANAKGTFTLTNGQKLTIVVGQPGAWNGQSGGSYAGGGGGGSFVFSGTSISKDSVLVAAGGGAGKLGNYSSGYDASSTTLNASLTSDGNPAGGANCQSSYLTGLGLLPNLGGSNGGGGLATFGASGNDSWVYNGGAGGGISSSGTAGGNYGQSGTAISSTAVGGGSGYPPFGDGSFGGGGGAGASSSAGGGGGYSGGGGGRRFNGNSSLNVDCQIAGGGGSFIASSATGSSIVLGNNTSGSVVIKRIS